MSTNQFANEPAVVRAIRLLGGPSEAARRLSKRTDTKLSQQRVSYWLSVERLTSAEFALAIEQELSGEVTRHDLRPDIYPQEAA